jgi:hypothetical protein
MPAFLFDYYAPNGNCTVDYRYRSRQIVGTGMLRENAEILMKLRPVMQLRFRSTEQFEQIKTSAARSELSVNEYILCAIEYAEEMTKKREHAS